MACTAAGFHGDEGNAISSAWMRDCYDARSLSDSRTKEFKTKMDENGGKKEHLNLKWSLHLTENMRKTRSDR